MKTVSKQVFGGRKFLMMAVLDMSGDREAEVELKKVELEELEVRLDELVEPFWLEVARGGSTEKVARMRATRSWCESCW